jgi:RND superfamily putative drug exporter
MAIVPSIMMLFGKANWWFPPWLDRILPKLSVDADDLAATQMPEDPGPEPQPELAGTLK